ncbi:MAG TPA: Hpt domain-containing protein, partial [Arenimonas sp.]|nr:Hpt domain-containing protein [Arenimonas sp.]
MNSVGEILQTFFAEARELLARMEEGLLQLEDDPADTDAIHAVFRAAHTIKGSAGLFDLKD